MNSACEAHLSNVQNLKGFGQNKPFEIGWKLSSTCFKMMWQNPSLEIPLSEFRGLLKNRFISGQKGTAFICCVPETTGSSGKKKKVHFSFTEDCELFLLLTNTIYVRMRWKKKMTTLVCVWSLHVFVCKETADSEKCDQFLFLNSTASVFMTLFVLTRRTKQTALSITAYSLSQLKCILTWLEPFEVRLQAILDRSFQALNNGDRAGKRKLFCSTKKKDLPFFSFSSNLPLLIDFFFFTWNH